MESARPKKPAWPTEKKRFRKIRKIRKIREIREIREIRITRKISAGPSGQIQRQNKTKRPPCQDIDGAPAGGGQKHPPDGHEKGPAKRLLKKAPAAGTGAC
ncbi:MAG: hypothetical protein LBO05_13635 [Deltaproteobacteria bacterium]|jgi:hypothetical protein|nr:hypothetical protein [Deltaproteobacteria bacterium]